MNALTILENGRTLLAKGHTKGAYARDAEGTAVEYDSPNACAYCGSGAVWAATNDEDFKVGSVAMQYLRGALPTGLVVPHYNDKETTTQADMLAVFDTAIANFKKDHPNEG